MKIHLIIALAGLFLWTSCRESVKQGLKDGMWRATLTIQNKEVPFLMEVENGHLPGAVVYLLNGAERVPLKGIYFHGDTVVIPVDSYDAELRGVYTEGNIKGHFFRLFLDNDPGIPFDAQWGESKRFETSGPSGPADPAGKWEVLFISDKGDTTRNVGIFARENERITGSVLTATGDLRFLEGTTTEGGFQLSAFSGLSPYLMEAVFNGEDSFTGHFYSSRSVTRLVGTRNEAAEPVDPYSMTWLREGYDRIAFSLPNIEGNMVSLSDEKYRNKVVILSILGSWCPNCLDEMEFLVPWYRENQSRGVEIIGLAFERKDDPEYVRMVLGRLIERYNVPYEILFAGTTGAESTAKALPALNKISSYPTTIFIDKKGEVRKIHTGFNGPATGQYYEAFQKEFNRLMDQLIAE